MQGISTYPLSVVQTAPHSFPLAAQINRGRLKLFASAAPLRRHICIPPEPLNPRERRVGRGSATRQPPPMAPTQEQRTRPIGIASADDGSVHQSIVRAPAVCVVLARLVRLRPHGPVESVPSSLTTHPACDRADIGFCSKMGFLSKSMRQFTSAHARCLASSAVRRFRAI